MRIIEVVSPQDIKSFLRLPHKLYANDPEWVCPLDDDIELVFDRSQNPYFKNGDAKRWLLLNNQQKAIGRVAAFYNEKHFTQLGRKIGGMGFFECIEDEGAAQLLLNTSKIC